MDERPRFWWLIPDPLWRMPADLAATLALTAVAVGVVFLPVINETVLRVLLGLPLVLFLPGYALIAALFPERGEPPTPIDDEEGAESSESGSDADRGENEPNHHQLSRRDRGIDGIERVALSFGLSIAVVPLLGLALNFTPWGIRLVPIVVTLTGFTVIATAVATYRRWELPEEDRFRVPYREWIDAARTEVFEPDDRTDAALNVILAISIVLALATVTLAIAVPPQGEQFSEFYLLTEDDDGERVAAGYPEALIQGEPAELIVGVGNNEHEPVEYTVVVLLESVTIDGNETIVDERHELATYETETLEHNETWHHRHEIVAPIVGDDLRVTYLLYKGSPPAEPSRESAYRDLHIWVDVVES